MTKSLRSGIVLAVGAVLWCLPPPGSLTAPSMHLIAIFVSTIAGLVLQPLPQGAVVIIGVATAAITGTLAPTDALSGYADSTVWLIVTAILVSRGFIITGLGRRIAYRAVRIFGRTTLGLAYAITCADLIMAPATPSNTARAGGILYPVIRSLSSCLGSEPGPTARRAGSFLMFNELQVNLVTCALFLTAVAPNAMIEKLAVESFGYRITWVEWFIAASVPAALSLAVLPLAIYLLMRPELKRSGEAVASARKELDALGAMTAGEKRMLGIFLAALVLWATGQWTGLNATSVALAGVGGLLILRVLRWEDVLSERGAWDALVWFGGLVSLASGLGKLGVITFLASALRSSLGGLQSWVLGFILAILAYVYIHYFVASMTAHATALYVPMGLVGVSLGAPVPLVVLVLGFMNSLNAGTTHYGTGPSPIYYAAGYIDQPTWWKYGFLISLLNLSIWLLLGGAWWKFLRLW